MRGVARITVPYTSRGRDEPSRLPKFFGLAPILNFEPFTAFGFACDLSFQDDKPLQLNVSRHPIGFHAIAASACSDLVSGASQDEY